jgi:hypothetical protein
LSLAGLASYRGQHYCCDNQRRSGHPLDLLRLIKPVASGGPPAASRRLVRRSNTELFHRARRKPGQALSYEPAGDQWPSCSPKTRREGLRSTSQSCRSCCARVDRDCAELDYRQTNAVRTVLHSRLDQCPRATHLFAHPALQLGCLLTHIRLHF